MGTGIDGYGYQRGPKKPTGYPCQTLVTVDIKVKINEFGSQQSKYDKTEDVKRMNKIKS